MIDNVNNKNQESRIKSQENRKIAKEKSAKKKLS